MSGIPAIKQDAAYGLRPKKGAPVRRTALVARQGDGTTILNTLNVDPSPVLLEIEDAYFNHDSAVMMPDLPAGAAGVTEPKRVENAERARRLKEQHPAVYEQFSKGLHDPDSEDGDGRVSGLGVLAATYKFLQLNAEYRLLLAGHADTSGDLYYNYGLSELRARSVLYLLKGDRTAWVDVCENKHKVEDYQRILKHYSRIAGVPTDPGPINNVHTPATAEALRNFQTAYNRRFSPMIAVDGDIGPQTWGAIFDLYQAELATMLRTDAQGLTSYRSALRFVDNAQPYIACSEKYPVDQPGRENFRSAENRRVELLFFRPPNVPFLGCHAGSKPHCMRTCELGECGVYAPGFFEFFYLDARLLLGMLPGKLATKFEIKPANEDLEHLPDKPDDEYSSSNETSDVGPVEAGDVSTAWEFLEFFADREPQEGSPERAVGAQL